MIAFNCFVESAMKNVWYCETLIHGVSSFEILNDLTNNYKSALISILGDQTKNCSPVLLSMCRRNPGAVTMQGRQPSYKPLVSPNYKCVSLKQRYSLVFLKGGTSYGQFLQGFRLGEEM